MDKTPRKHQAIAALLIMALMGGIGWAGEDLLPPAGLSPELSPENPQQDAAEKPSRRAKTKRKSPASAGEELQTSPLLKDILALRWEAATAQNPSDDTKRIGLEKIFDKTLDHSIAVKQAEGRIKDAEVQGKEIRNPGLFGLLNPIDLVPLGKAAEAHVQAARLDLQAVRQKALLESARLHAGLMQAFLSKYLAFQAIEQGRNQLNADEQRFKAGETTRFDVTQTQMALIDRYGKYLAADNAYHSASISLASQIGESDEKSLVPEGFVLQDDTAVVTPFSLLPQGLTLEKVLKAAETRPELQALGFRQQALKQLIKAASGLDKQKKEGEHRQLELEIQKARKAAEVLAEKAYADYQLADKSLSLAQQRHNLASQFVRQMQISHQAGFSSTKDVLDSQVELARAKAALVGAQVAHNLSQIQLLYEMGLLNEHVLTRPPSFSNLP